MEDEYLSEPQLVKLATALEPESTPTPAAEYLERLLRALSIPQCEVLIEWARGKAK
jgi:hypothetical protein